jgi:hypothetical protein
LETTVRSKKVALIFALLLAFTGASFEAASAETYVQFTGKISFASGVNDPGRTYVLVLGDNGLSISTQVRSDGTYQLIFPARNKVKVVLNYRGLLAGETSMEKRTSQDVDISNWQTEISAMQDRSLDFVFPKPFKLNVKVVDAQNNLIADSLIRPRSFDSKLVSIVNSTGNTWTGSQNWSDDSGGGLISKNGEFEIWNYPLSDFGGIEVQLRGTTYLVSRSVPFPLKGTTSVKYCLPINFGASRTLPTDCLAADSDQRDGAEKAAADAFDSINKAQQNLQDQLKKLSEKVCKKGKLTKKVSIKSKCPKGYK